MSVIDIIIGLLALWVLLLHLGTIVLYLAFPEEITKAVGPFRWLDFVAGSLPITLLALHALGAF